MRRLLQRLFRSSLALACAGLIASFAIPLSATAQISLVTASLEHLAPVPLVTPAPGTACGLTEHEQQLAAQLIEAPAQNRPELTCNPTLADVARQRAKDMAARDYFAHTTPDGLGPNYLVRQAGYELPSRYSTTKRANNIESIGAGYPTAEGVWQALLDSPTHRTHLLAEYPFYAGQVEYGIGYAEGGHYGHYWVIITAKPARPYTATRSAVTDR